MRKIMIFLLCLGLFVSVIPGVSAQEADWLANVQAQMEATPRVSVDNSVVNASIIFQNVAEPTTCTLRWYIGDILCAEDFHFQLRNGELYPTHQLGPITKVLGINRGNRFVSLVSMASKSRGLNEWIKKNKGEDYDLANYDFNEGDIVSIYDYEFEFME